MQQQQEIARSTAAAAATHQLFSYKMASSFQNPTTTAVVSNVSSSSPGGVSMCGYDYRLGGGMAGGSPNMTNAQQWWYVSPNMDNNMQNNMNSMQNLQQNVQSVGTPPPVVGNSRKIKRDIAGFVVFSLHVTKKQIETRIV